MFSKIAFTGAAIIAMGAQADRVKCRYEAGIYDGDVTATAIAKFFEHDDDTLVYTGIFKNGNANTNYNWALYDVKPEGGDDDVAAQGELLFSLRTNADGKANVARLILDDLDMDLVRDRYIGISCAGSGVVASCLLE